MTYKMFTQHVRPILQKENPKAPSSKIMMLTAAKWREFCEENPNLKEEEPEGEKSEEEEEEEEEPELEYQPKPSRSRRGAEKQEEPEESDEDDNKRKKRGTVRVSKKGRKKVPTLKIKFGKKKDQSSDEEKVKFYNIMFSNCLTNFLFLRKVTLPVKSVTAMQSLRKCC